MGMQFGFEIIILGNSAIDLIPFGFLVRQDIHLMGFIQ
jgi:hypothetical protein